MNGKWGHGGGLWRHGDAVEPVRETIQAGMSAVQTRRDGGLGKVTPMAEPRLGTGSRRAVVWRRRWRRGVETRRELGMAARAPRLEERACAVGVDGIFGVEDAVKPLSLAEQAVRVADCGLLVVLAVDLKRGLGSRNGS